MSDYMEAKKMPAEPLIASFTEDALRLVFADGYSFQDPHYNDGRPAVEIFIKQITDRKSDLFAAAMRTMAMEYHAPCGVTRQINGTFRAETTELKKLLIEASGIQPDGDTNLSVEEP